MLATIFGGGALEVGKSLFSNLTLSYAVVFGIQAIEILIAVGLLSRVDVSAFRANTKAAISTILQGELD